MVDQVSLIKLLDFRYLPQIHVALLYKKAFFKLGSKHSFKYNIYWYTKYVFAFISIAIKVKQTLVPLKVHLLVRAFYFEGFNGINTVIIAREIRATYDHVALSLFVTALKFNTSG